MSVETIQTSASGATSTATIMAAGGTGFAFQVFRPKSAASKATDAKPISALPKSVQAVVEAADALVAGYNKLKTEVLDRSDRALWEELEKGYAFAAQIDSSPTKRSEEHTSELQSH